MLYVGFVITREGSRYGVVKTSTTAQKYLKAAADANFDIVFLDTGDFPEVFEGVQKYMKENLYMNSPDDDTMF